jgi:hypothetical protein
MTLNVCATLGSGGFELPAPLSHGREYDPLLRLIALSTKKPKRQTACVVIGCARSCRTANAQRALLAGFSPTATLHDHPHQHSNRLSQALVPLGLNCAQKFVDARQRFKFPHDTGHWGPVMMRLGFLHTPLPISVVEEFERLAEGLVGIVQNIGERSALSIFQEFFACDSSFDHDWLLADSTEYGKLVLPLHLLHLQIL